MKKYQIIPWNKLTLFLLTILALYACNNNRYKRLASNVTFSSMYISLDVRYANNKSRVVLQNEELYARIRMPERLYKRRLLQVLENRDTLTVDSIVYVSLQKYIVIPQRRIDSIYQGKVENLLASPLFCDKQTMVLEKVTNEEERYIIDILFRHDYFMTVDDESGYPFIDYTAK